MPNLNDICFQISQQNENITAAAVIEQNSALLLGLASETEDYSLDYFETIAAAAVNIFRGRNIKTVEKMIADMRGVPATSSIEEVQLVMQKNSVFISSIDSKPDILFFIMATKEADVDRVWTELRKNRIVVAEAAP